jgi:hypothetical protein
MLTRRSRLKYLEVMRDGFVGCLIVVMLALPNHVDSVLAGQTAEALSALFLHRWVEVRKLPEPTVETEETTSKGAASG